jgi:hypothetical protein
MEHALRKKSLAIAGNHLLCGGYILGKQTNKWTVGVASLVVGWPVVVVMQINEIFVMIFVELCWMDVLLVGVATGGCDI